MGMFDTSLCSNNYNTVYSMLSIISVLVPFTCQALFIYIEWKNNGFGGLGAGS